MAAKRHWQTLKRSIAQNDFAALVARILPWLVRAEKLLRPRLLLATLVALSIPFGNMLPALAISFLELGLLERDGVWILIGLFVAAAASVVVSGVVIGLLQAEFYGVERWLQ